ncbi:hypothetical protein WJX84_010883 [Apatococcus fuscideae]|uniref:Metalloenzyme domain-containing protein n=1 Tax=Apatococcus fuscideae TaxID=2026836 RepID=A0AAW1T524_9CHLO
MTCDDKHKRLQTLITPGKWMLLADHGNDVELVPHARYGLPPEKIHPDLALYPQQPTASYGVKSAVQVVDLRAAFLTAGMSLEAAEAALDTSPSLQLHGRIGDSRKGYATGRDPVLLGFHAPTQSSNQPVSQKEYGMANEGMPGVALIGWLTLT